MRVVPGVLVVCHWSFGHEENKGTRREEALPGHEKATRTDTGTCYGFGEVKAVSAQNIRMSAHFMFLLIT